MNDACTDRATPEQWQIYAAGASISVVGHMSAARAGSANERVVKESKLLTVVKVRAVCSDEH